MPLASLTLMGCDGGHTPPTGSTQASFGAAFLGGGAGAGSGAAAGAGAGAGGGVGAEGTGAGVHGVGSNAGASAWRDWSILATAHTAPARMPRRSPMRNDRRTMRA